MLSNSRTRRISGHSKLTEKYSSSSLALDEALLLAQPESLDQLEPSPRVNLFSFLQSASIELWTEQRITKFLETAKWMDDNRTRKNIGPKALGHFEAIRKHFEE